MTQLVATGFLDAALALGDPLDLAGPYLSLDILCRLRPRRILVDVEAWAASSSQPLGEAHDALAGCERRHLRGLHAKLAVGPRGALVGSANFTQGGMERNVELGMRLDDPVAAQAWFEARWTVAVPFVSRDLAAYEASRPDAPPRAARPPFRAAEPSMPSCVEECLPSGEDEARLVRALRKFPNAATAHAYLDLLRRFYDDLGLPPDDGRLSLLSSRRKGDSTFRVNVNNRMALTWNGRRDANVNFSLDKGLAQALLVGDPIFRVNYRFKDASNRPLALNLRLCRPQDLAGRREVWAAVVDWARLELAASRAMGGRRVYEPAAGRLVYDGAMRDRLFEEAFAEEGP